jgi:hypothetical protein
LNDDDDKVVVATFQFFGIDNTLGVLGTWMPDFAVSSGLLQSLDFKLTPLVKLRDRMR